MEKLLIEALSAPRGSHAQHIAIKQIASKFDALEKAAKATPAKKASTAKGAK